jgi:hypothetical protein
VARQTRRYNPLSSLSCKQSRRCVVNSSCVHSGRLKIEQAAQRTQLHAKKRVRTRSTRPTASARTTVSPTGNLIATAPTVQTTSIARLSKPATHEGNTKQEMDSTALVRLLHLDFARHRFARANPVGSNQKHASANGGGGCTTATANSKQSWLTPCPAATARSPRDAAQPH